MRVAILNAYARSNAGDGLLVDETMKLVRCAAPDAQFSLVAMDRRGFVGFDQILNPVAGPDDSMTASDLLGRLVTGRPHRDVGALIDRADIAVAVGGGYLRADTPIAALKAYLSHVTQLPHRRSVTPVIYMPQSIGPLPPRLLPLGFDRLKRARAVFVRDDRSLAELRARGIDSERAPDLAALSIATRPIQVARGSGYVGLVARRLRDPDGVYGRRIDDLRRTLAAVPLVQSSGRGNDDPSFYESIGWSTGHRSVRAALDSHQKPSVMVSVRLHGALQSILAGVPSIHLSYERKGWGAYEDLGIAEYVHHVREFDPEVVAGQVRRLMVNPSSYWDAIEGARPRLLEARKRVISTIQAAVSDATSEDGRGSG